MLNGGCMQHNKGSKPGNGFRNVIKWMKTLSKENYFPESKQKKTFD